MKDNIPEKCSLPFNSQAGLRPGRSSGPNMSQTQALAHCEGGGSAVSHKSSGMGEHRLITSLCKKSIDTHSGYLAGSRGYMASATVLKVTKARQRPWTGLEVQHKASSFPHTWNSCKHVN